MNATCDGCGIVTYPACLEEFDGIELCEACAICNTFDCEDCFGGVIHGTGYIDENIALCLDCKEAYYTNCCYCKKVIRKDDPHRHECKPYCHICAIPLLKEEAMVSDKCHCKTCFRKYLLSQIPAENGKEYDIKEDLIAIKMQIKVWERELDNHIKGMQEIREALTSTRYVDEELWQYLNYLEGLSNDLEGLSHEMMAINM